MVVRGGAMVFVAAGVGWRGKVEEAREAWLDGGSNMLSQVKQAEY